MPQKDSTDWKELYKLLTAPSLNFTFGIEYGILLCTLQLFYMVYKLYILYLQQYGETNQLPTYKEFSELRRGYLIGLRTLK